MQPFLCSPGDVLDLRAERFLQVLLTLVDARAVPILMSRLDEDSTQV